MSPCGGNCCGDAYGSTTGTLMWKGGWRQHWQNVILLSALSQCHDTCSTGAGMVWHTDGECIGMCGARWSELQ